VDYQIKRKIKTGLITKISKKASSENNKLEKNVKNTEFSLAITDDISKKIQMQMEKINNDELLKNYNEHSSSNDSRVNSNLNLPGLNSLNEMNKQTHLYTYIRK